MWKIGTVAGVQQKVGASTSPMGGGRPLVAFAYYMAKPWWPRGMLRRPLKKHSRSIQCRRDQPQAPPGPAHDAPPKCRRPAQQVGALIYRRLTVSDCLHCDMNDSSDSPF